MYNLIGKQFKKPSGVLGRIISRAMAKGNINAYEQLFGNIKLSPGDQALEIGFGPGLGIHFITEKFDSVLVDGIDFSNLMYSRAFKKFKAKIKKGLVNLYYGDFIGNPIPKKYDLIYCINVVYFWKDLKEPFSKAKSMLKPGGLFSFYMSSKEELDKYPFTKEGIFNKYSPHDVTSALNALGYSYDLITLEKGFIVKARA